MIDGAIEGGYWHRHTFWLYPVRQMLSRHQDSVDRGGSSEVAPSRSPSATAVRGLSVAGSVGQRTTCCSFQTAVLRGHERIDANARRPHARRECSWRVS